ncbi:MAG: hypothetical protein QXT45_06445 [Candidatus Bilamarchaeaceae archaeon]
MCILCKRAKESRSYNEIIKRMVEEDVARLEFTKKFASEMQFLNSKCYSSINWPVHLIYPMFEARMAYAIPNNYFQPVLLNGEKLGNMFSHGAMRSVFFVDERLILFSKTTNHRNGNEFFTSFLLLHLNNGEYRLKIDGESFFLSSEIKKPMKNLVTGAVEEKSVKFNLVHTSVKGRIITKEKVLTSAQFRNIYSKYGGAQARSASIDLEGYAITVPHFAPHPYLLRLKEEFGFSSNRQFQEHVIDYFREHSLAPSKS